MLSSLVCSAALLLGPAPARADIAISGHRRLPSEAVITGLRDFPAYRFVIAVHSHRPDPDMFKHRPLPQPVAVREGEPVGTDGVYFQELRAIPADTPDPVTDEWVLASRAPASGSLMPRPVQVPLDSGDRVARARFHARQVQAGWISLELLSYVAVMADGSERPLSKVIPVTYTVESFQAPPDWQLFLMADPSWPRAEPPLPAVPCEPNELLPLSPGPRTLVAVRGSVGPDGSLDGKQHLVWGYPLDAWRREEVPVESAAAGRRVDLEVRVEPDGTLGMTHGGYFLDAEGRAFHDEDLKEPVDRYYSWQWWAAGGAACVALLAAGAWTWRRRRRTA